MISKFLFICLLVIALPVKVKFAYGNYLGLSVWSTPGCVGQSAYFTQSYKLDECLLEISSATSFKTIYLNATHWSQVVYDSADCSGPQNTEATLVGPVGVCQPEIEGFYSISFFSETAGPFSTTPSGGFTTIDERTCDDGDSVLTLFESPFTCNPGQSVVAYKTRCDGNGNFFVDTYDTADCSDDVTVVPNPPTFLDCAENVSVIADVFSSTECWTYSGTCQGSVNIVARTGDDSHWEVNGVSYKIFDITVQNTGTCKIVSTRLPYTLNGEVDVSWGLSFYGDDIIVTTWSDIHPGQTTTSSGLILANYGVPHYSPVTGGPSTFICAC